MLAFEQNVIALSLGQFGPFRDDPNYGTPEARTIPFVTIVGGNGGDPLEVTAADGTDLTAIPLMTPVTLRLEVYGRGRNAKLRTYGLAAAASSPDPAAA